METTVGHFEFLLLLMAIVIGLEVLARRLKLPAAAALIAGGIGLALTPAMPTLALDPNLVLVLFLPPLLMASAYFTAWRDFKADLRIILQLAVGAVAFTTFVVGVAAHWLAPTLPWAACFTLGAIVSPPDAVAAKAVLKNLRLPPRVTVLLEGESLVNDASGLVLFRFAVAAALTGSFSASHAAVSFVVLAAGGVAAGVLFGLGTSFLTARLREPNLAIALSLLTAWVSYIGANAAGVSGVLSTVACGLVVGWRQHKILSADTRMQARGVWEMIVFVFESLIFILIGLSLRGVLSRFGGGWDAILALLPAAAVLIAAVVLARFAWIFPATYIPRAVFPALRRRDPAPPIAVPIVMSWAGMRGVVSLAAALSLPADFPGRDFILAMSFSVILATVLVQGATLGPLIRLLRLEGLTLTGSTTLPEAAARARLAQAQLAAVEAQSAQADGTQLHPRLVEQYNYRARAATNFSQAVDDLSTHRQAHFAVVLNAVTAARAELLKMHRAQEIQDSVLHTLEQELDLEEMTARHFAGQE
jgi:CPA1 family monovalent cation:H+ antiporter